MSRSQAFGVYKGRSNLGGNFGISAKASSTPTPPSFASTKSFQFDGITDKFGGIATYNTSDNAEKITISSWINLDSSSNNSTYLCGVDGGSLFSFAVRLQTLTNTTCWLYTNDASNSARASANLGAIKNTGWHHLMVCLDLSLANTTECQIFFDGILQTTTGNFTLGFLKNSTSQLQIGASSLGFLGGNVDEFAIWVGSDQRANVSEIWNGGLPNDLNTLPTAPQPTNWFRMGEFATWNGRAFSMTDVNNSYVVRSQGLNASDPNPTTDVPLFDNKSFAYDGVSDAVVIGTTSLGITNSISVSAWVKIPTTNTGGGGTNIQEIICEDTTSSGQRNWTLAWRGTPYNRFQFVVFHTNLSATATLTTSITPNDGNWHHLLGTFDGTTNTNGVKLYIDGVLNNQTTALSTGINSYTNSEPNIGRLTGQNQWNFEGNINDVSVFDNDQSANASTIFNGGLPNDISALSPLGYWRAEQVTFDGTDWTLIDQGSGGNNGTSVSMPLTARTSDVPLFDNKSFTYDGIADYVDCGTITALNGGVSVFSTSLWFKYSGTLSTSDNIILSGGSTTSDDFYIQPTSATNIRYGHSSSFTDTTVSTMLLNTWYNLILVHNGTGFSIYLNGILQGSSTGKPSPATNLGTNFNIGRYNISSAFNFNGLINDISVFNTDESSNALTIFNGGIVNDISSLNPLGYWRAEEVTWDGSNWTMIDQGSGANNGLTSSMPLTSRTSDVPT